MSRAAAARQDDVASPCIDICRMNPASRFCEGCRRSLDEIAAWSSMTAEEKCRVLAQLPARRAPC